MNYLLIAIIGWCGTGWPIRFPSVGGGGTEPGDWPTNCPMCGRIIGALSAIVLWMVLGPLVADAGFVGLVTLSFFGGSFGASLISGLGGMMKAK